jgi:S1-C subfamily serine protease
MRAQRRNQAATVVILAGEGAGRLRSIATGIVISKDGVILTALHAIKGAAEVQVRMANGDVFDHVELLVSGERRDVAALKIAAGALSVLAIGTTTVFAVNCVRSPLFDERQKSSSRANDCHPGC